MSFEQTFIKTEDGTVVTATTVEPPRNWTKDYEEMGGDEMWGDSGSVVMEVRGRGLEDQIKPHFGTQAYTGESMGLFEMGSDQFFLFNIMDGTLFQVMMPTDLESIVALIDDADMGLAALELEQV